MSFFNKTEFLPHNSKSERSFWKNYITSIAFYDTVTRLSVWFYRSPHSPTHLRKLKSKFSRKSLKSSQTPLTPPPLRCCVSCRQPSAGSPWLCNNARQLQVPPQVWKTSSPARASPRQLQDSPQKSCTKLWTWSISTTVPGTTSTVTTAMASTTSSRTDTGMIDWCRPCSRCWMIRSESQEVQRGKKTTRERVGWKLESRRVRWVREWKEMFITGPGRVEEKMRNTQNAAYLIY